MTSHTVQDLYIILFFVCFFRKTRFSMEKAHLQTVRKNYHMLDILRVTQNRRNMGRLHKKT